MDQDAYSYRDDKTVPDFDEDRILLVMDGDCALCSWGARNVARFDHGDRFRIATVNSDLGRALLIHYGLDPNDPDSWLMIEYGSAKTSMDAILAASRHLGWVRFVLAPFGWLPKSLQDWLYQRMARNRYAMFGRTDMCALPDKRLRARLLG
ncbi:MAG: DCC1-like thiol-disulfide oxidoreductase family protein [Pseudomonadota bacterium]